MLTQIGSVAQTVVIPDAALLLGHKLTGSRDLGVNRVQLEHAHDMNLLGRIAQFRRCLRNQTSAFQRLSLLACKLIVLDRPGS
jgi:hypothetical protein